MKVTDKYVFFWRSILGNWTSVPGGIIANVDGKIIKVPTSEHLFMYLKAIFFKDYETADRILKAPSPKEAKNLGRQVRNFSEDLWETAREAVMEQAVKCRAAYDERFVSELCRSEYSGKTFVEASPYDRIWGIGVPEEDCSDTTKFLGLNLLGKVLTGLRDEIETKNKSRN